jgi:hypothetical protein
MFCRPIILCLLNCIIEIIQVTEGHKHFPRGPHVGQPWSNEWHFATIPVNVFFHDTSDIYLLELSAKRGCKM